MIAAAKRYIKRKKSHASVVVNLSRARRSRPVSSARLLARVKPRAPLDCTRRFSRETRSSSDPIYNPSSPSPRYSCARLQHPFVSSPSIVRVERRRVPVRLRRSNSRGIPNRMSVVRTPPSLRLPLPLTLTRRAHETYCNTGTIPLGCTLRSTASSSASTIAPRSSSRSTSPARAPPAPPPLIAPPARGTPDARRSPVDDDSLRDVPGDDDRRRVAVWERAPFERVSSVFALRRAAGDVAARRRRGRARDRRTDRRGRVRSRPVRQESHGCARRPRARVVADGANECARARDSRDDAMREEG